MMRAKGWQSGVTVEVVLQRRFRCPHCRRSWAHKRAAEDHVARCWSDPAKRTCSTCRHKCYTEYGDRRFEAVCSVLGVDCYESNEDGRSVVRHDCHAWQGWQSWVESS